jgi:hypothetical protein
MPLAGTSDTEHEYSICTGVRPLGRLSGRARVRGNSYSYRLLASAHIDLTVEEMGTMLAPTEN